MLSWISSIRFSQRSEFAAMVWRISTISRVASSMRADQRTLSESNMPSPSSSMRRDSSAMVFEASVSWSWYQRSVWRSASASRYSSCAVWTKLKGGVAWVNFS